MPRKKINVTETDWYRTLRKMGRGRCPVFRWLRESGVQTYQEAWRRCCRGAGMLCLTDDLDLTGSNQRGTAGIERAYDAWDAAPPRGREAAAAELALANAIRKRWPKAPDLSRLER